ncbi:hypothetical protein ACQKE5_02845 [Paenisporosarcina sp. NPDC076898]|uniref:hypothetical protein n=1 Tax=Paenisporosarcina sp. NPDC076898 TaxID=3390603 RepID=UPI003D0015DD
MSLCLSGGSVVKIGVHVGKIVGDVGIIAVHVGKIDVDVGISPNPQKNHPLPKE